MIVIDMVIICITSILIEYKLLKGKYMFFSSFTNFNISFFIVYLLPMILYKISPNEGYFIFLNQEVINSGYIYIRIFYYVWFILTLMFFFKIRRCNIVVSKGFKKPTNDYLVFVWVVMIGLYFISISAPLGFNPILTFNRLVNPRAFTYIRAGYGPLNHILSVIKLLMLVLATCIFMYKKSIGRFLVLVFSLIINILGGSKSSFLNFLIVFILISFKMDFKFKKIKLRKLIKYGIFGGVLLVVAFMVFYKPGEIITVNEALSGLKEYQKEAYYTLNVLNDFEWSSKYTFEGFLDTITPFIPRAIWSDKPYSGFYQRYWRPIYEPNAVLYQTSTFGALAEAYMMFGYFGTVIYAILFYMLCKKIFLYYQKTNTFFGMFVVAYVQCGMYFFIRGGLFSSTVVAFVYQAIIAYVLVVVFQRLFKNNNKSEETFICRKI